MQQPTSEMPERPRGVDHRAIKVLLAVLELEQRELADGLGYDSGYVANIVNGFTPPSQRFKAAFGTLVADLLLGDGRKPPETYPAGPLKELITRKAAQAASKTEFYADLGISCHGWKEQQRVAAELVDRVCCRLGVHPSSIYPEFMIAAGDRCP